MIKSTFAKYAELISIVVVVLIVFAWVFLAFFMDDRPDRVDPPDDTVESDAGDESETDSPAVPEPENGKSDDVETESGVPPGADDSAEDTDDSTADAIDDAQPGQDLPDPTDDAPNDGKGVGDETDSPAVSEPEEMITDNAGADDGVSSAANDPAEYTEDTPTDATDEARPGQDVPLDPTDDADEPDTGEATARDDDASDDGKGVGDETDSPAVSKPEEMIADDAGADDGVSPAANGPAEVTDDTPTDATGDAQPDQEGETDPSGDGSDSGEDGETEADRLGAVSEDGKTGGSGTDGGVPSADDDSAEGLDGSVSDGSDDDAQPDQEGETDPSGDGSDSGEDGETEADRLGAGSEDGRTGDDGTDGDPPPVDDDSAEGLAGSVSDGSDDDAQPGQEDETDPVGDGSDSGENGETEADRLGAGSEDGKTGDDGTDGDPPSVDDDSAEDSDSSTGDSGSGEQPVVNNDPSGGADASVQGESVILPTFDVVRVDQFKFATIAGRGMPNWTIDVMINSELKESDTIGRDGQFAFVFQLDAESELSEIALLSRDGDGTIYRSSETVVVLTPESVEAPESDDIQLASAEPLLPAVLIATPESIKLKQPPIPGRPAGNPGENLQIDSISYDIDGEVVITGRGSAKGFIKIYLDNLPIKTEQITDFGTWEIALPGVDAGRYMLKIEELDQSNKVVASVITPFQKEFQRDALEKMKEAAQASGKSGAFDVDDGRIADIVTVQPGYTLWEISRRSFGQGRFYVRIYHTNINQIDDPDLIFPGQLLVVPNFETAPPRRPFPN